MVESISLQNTNSLEIINMDKTTTMDYILDYVDWGAIESNHHSYKYVNQTGVYVTGSTLETRTVTVSGWVCAENDLLMTRRKSTLNKFFNPKETIVLYYSNYSLKFLPNTTIRYSTVYSDNNELVCKFKIEGLCPDPLFSETKESSVVAANIVPMFNFPLIIPGVNLMPTPPVGAYVRYSASPDGSNMVERPTPETLYRGIGYMPEEISTNPNLYDGTKDFSGNKWANLTAYINDVPYNGLTVKKRTSAWSGLYQKMQGQEGEIYTVYGYIKTEPESKFNCNWHIGVVTEESASISTIASYKNGVIQTTHNGNRSDNEFSWMAYTFKILKAGAIKPGFEMSTTGAIYVCGLTLIKGVYDPSVVWKPSPADWIADPKNYSWSKMETRYSAYEDGSNMTTVPMADTKYIGVGYMPSVVWEHENLIENSTGNLGSITPWAMSSGGVITVGVVDGPALELTDTRPTPTSSRVNIYQIPKIDKRTGNITVSFQYKATIGSIVGGYGIGAMLRFEMAENPNLDIINTTDLMVADGQWHEAKLTRDLSLLGDRVINRIVFYLFTNSGTVTYKNVKLEYGDTPTTWTPTTLEWPLDKKNYNWSSYKGKGTIFGYKQPSLIMNVINNGSLATGMKILFKANGVLTNPSLTNVDTQEFIKINKTMQNGEEIEINTIVGEKKIIGAISGVKSNYFKYRDLDSKWLQIDVGSNLFRYDAETNIENLEVYIYFNNKYLEVQECY